MIMASRTALLLLCVWLPFLILGQFHDGLTHHVVLGNNDMFYLYWKSGGKAGTDYIEFEVQVRTKGWIGLGFSPNGAMAGSDIAIMWIDTNGQPHISDRHGPTQGANGFPPEDAEQNYEIVAARENGTHTIIRFKRRQSTCDINDWQITTDTTRLIWALNNEKPKSSDGIKRHSADMRGVRSVHLSHPQTKNRAQEIYRQPGVKTMDVFVKNVTVPHESHTFYWCQIFQVPKFNKKHHLVGHEMLVQPGHEKYVHHLLIYGCRKNMSQFLDKPLVCFGGDNTEFSKMRDCSDFLNAWGVGGEPFAYPDGMASIWHGDVYDYILGEFHYDNSDFKKDIVDNSGMRLYLSETLRPVETGRLTMGSPIVPYQVVIPPKTESFIIYSYCPAECTMNLQDEPITIFSGFLHTHLLGVKVRLRHLRKGVELGEILVDNHYDFNYQTTIVLDKHPKILPGDDLILECEYNSKDREVPTFGGVGTSEEMCMVFLEYYPKRRHLTELCVSAPSPDSFAKMFGAKKVVVTMDAEKTSVINAKGQNQTFKDMVKEIDWGANSAKRRYGFVQDLEKFGRDEPHNIGCFIFPKNNNDRKPSFIQLEKNPVVTISFDRMDPVCKECSHDSASCTTAIFFAALVVAAFL